MWPLPPTIRDHRGRRLPLYAPRRDEANRDDFPEDEFRVLKQRVGEGSVFELLAAPVMVWGIVLLTGAGVTYRIAKTGGFVWPVVLFLGVALVGAVFSRRLPPASSRHVAGAMLELKRCPSCAFTLVGRAPEPDRCVICPECGGAWILPRDIFAPGIFAPGDTPEPPGWKGVS